LEKKTKGYSLSIEYVNELVDELELQIENSKCLLRHFLAHDDEKIYGFQIFLVSEILWCNYYILDFLNKEIDTAVFLTKKEDAHDNPEMVMTEESMLAMQKLILSRYQATFDLNKLSYSVSVH